MQRRFYHRIGRIIRQRQPPDQAVAAQLAVVVTVRQTGEAFGQVEARFTHMLKKAVLQDAIDHRQPSRRHQRITVVGTFQLAHFKTAGFATRQQRRQRHAAAEAFAEGDDVGAYSVVLFGKQGTATANAGLDFVEDQQDAQLAAQPFHTFEVVLGRRDNAGFALDRLEQDGDGLRIDCGVQGWQIIEGHVAEARQLRFKTIFGPPADADIAAKLRPWQPALALMMRWAPPRCSWPHLRASLIAASTASAPLLSR